MKKFLFDCGTRDPNAAVGIFALRFMLGAMMLFGHGIPKLMAYGKIKDTFPVPDFFPLTFMSPPVSLLAALFAEVVCSICLILGVATRPAAFLLGFTMVVAAFNIHSGAPWFIGPGVSAAKEPALLYLVPMIAIIFTGAGLWSVDAKIIKDSRRRRW
jgi:putative oxidoreductase